MRSIFKKEMRLYFSDIRSYIAAALVMLLSAIFAVVFNMMYGYSSLSYMLVYLGYAEVILVPLFALFMQRREDRASLESFEYSLPISPTSRALGKFFAFALQTLLPTLPIILYPIILAPYGDTNAAASYLMIVVFWLLLFALSSLSHFIFTSSKNRWVAFGVSVAASLAVLFLGVLSDIIPTSPTVSLLGTLLLALWLFGTVFLATKSIVASVLPSGICVIISVVFYFSAPDSFASVLSKSLALLSLFPTFNFLAYDILSLQNILVCLAFCAFFLLLTLSLRERRRINLPQIKRIALGSSVLAVALLLNFALLALPHAVSHINIGDSGIFKISSSSKKFLHDLGDDASEVEILFVCYDGKPDYQISEFLERYVAQNKKITYRIVDPERNADEILSITDSNTLPANYSLIVRSDKRMRVVTYEELYFFYNEALGKFYASNYQTYFEQYTQYFYTYPTNLYFDGEYLLSNAINYVVSDNVPTIYALAGHEEIALSKNFTYLVELNNYDLKSLDLTLSGTIPSDCSGIIINAPRNDISDTELSLIKNYVAAGGKLFITVSHTLEHKNISELLSLFSVTHESGMVYEGDENHYIQKYPEYIIATPLDHEITGETAQSYALLLLRASSLKIAEELPEGTLVDQLFVTTESAYKVSVENIGKDDPEILSKGIFTLALAATLSNGTSPDAKLVCFASENMIDDVPATYTGGGNYAFMLSTLEWLTDKDTTVISAGADILSNSLSFPTGMLILWAIVTIVIFPAATISAGLIVRKKRNSEDG